MSNKNNTMPNNLEAEQALLGSMIVDTEILSELIDKLNSEDFYQESHQYILKAMKIIFAERKPIDVVTIADRLEKEGDLDKTGGIAYLTDLTQMMPSTANYSYYLDIVQRDSLNRALIRASRDVITLAMESDDATESVQYAEERIYNLSQKNYSSTLKDIRESDAVDKVLEKFQIIANDKDALRGVPTGFTHLDRLTNGLQKSDLIVLAARPGMGKTSFAMNVVEHAAMVHDKVCAVFSLEMPMTQIVQRLLCGFSKVSMADALSGRLSQKDWKVLVRCSEQLRNSRIYIDDSSRVTPAEILSKCRRIKARNNGQLDLVMIDYIQLMSSGRKSDEGNRVQEVATITRELKIMAKELDVPVIALSQLRRINTKDGGDEPQLTDLRESGAIEQDADIVMFIHRPDVFATPEQLASPNCKIEKGMANIIIAKHRNGALDRVKLRFRGEITKFVNPDNGQTDEPIYGSSTGNTAEEQVNTQPEPIDNGSDDVDGIPI